MAERPRNYTEFWPLYLAEHSRPLTRALHYLGTGLGLAIASAAVASRSELWLLAALTVGYGFAWIGHFFVEKNRPTTFTYPVWSFISDIRMFGLFAAGRMGRELKKNGIDT